MKNMCGIALYVFFTVHIAFGMEDNMGQYYQDFDECNKAVQTIYIESKALPNITDRLTIGKMVLDFYQDQKQRSAYNDQQFFYKQQRSLQERLVEIKNKQAVKNNSLKNNNYFVEDDLDSQDDFDIAQNRSFEDQLDDIKFKINNILKSNQQLSTIIEQLDKNILVANNQFNIDILKNTKLVPQQKNGTLHDKIVYATELLIAVDNSLIDLKQKGIDDAMFVMLNKELCKFANKINECTFNAQIDQSIKLKSIDILKAEIQEKVLFRQLCINAKQTKKCNFVYSWENFCSWKNQEERMNPESNLHSIENHINKYIEHTIDNLNVAKDKLFNYFRNFTIHNDTVFNTELSNEINVTKTYNQFTDYVNLILNCHYNTLALLAENEQYYFIDQLLKNAGFLFVRDINFVNDIATLPFDELLFLGSIFYDYQKKPGDIIPTGYVIDCIKNPNQEGKTPNECIQMHLYNYRTLKKELFPTYSHILPNQSLVLHALARIYFQDSVRIAKQDFDYIKKIITESTPENQGPLLGSVYGFCRFINQYTYDKDNGLLSESKGRLEPYFATWHEHFNDTLDQNKFNFENHSYQAIVHLVRTNPLFNTHFGTLLHTPTHNKPAQSKKEEDDDVLKNPTYGGGLCWSTNNFSDNNRQQSIEYNKPLLEYIVTIAGMQTRVTKNRNISNDSLLAEARELYDKKILDNQKNAEKIKYYTDLINEAKNNLSSENDIRTFLAKRLKKETEKEFEQYKKNNPQIDISDIIYVYSILMHGKYITSIACPSIFNKDTSLKEFAKKYKSTLQELQKLQGFDSTNKSNTQQHVLELMFINWWKPLYKPADNETFDDYLAKKENLLKKGKEINHSKYLVGRECNPVFLIKECFKTIKKGLEQMDEYYMWPSKSFVNTGNNVYDNYINHIYKAPKNLQDHIINNIIQGY